MAYSRLLLLLIGVISCHLPEIQARPNNFWCSPQARKTMERKTEGLRKDMATCVGENMLPSPVQLPCVSINTTEWANKTLRQKHAEVVEALQVFQGGVQGAKDQTTSGCLMSLLEKLEHLIKNYLVIVSSVQIQVAERRQCCDWPSRPDHVTESNRLETLWAERKTQENPTVRKMCQATPHTDRRDQTGS
ncbi:thrombopoietin isoform X2 [Epinephelus fuscoguttatus]|uniref:thrombopoietin isoform X2 n=1 Tax=Epinephelus fuscoguttatus TaxID=293821 RepID=UPI0020D07C25|nr:thrombopoietin isoform X2 [Epinephelus fuscoguttatus]